MIGFDCAGFFAAGSSSELSLDDSLAFLADGLTPFDVAGRFLLMELHDSTNSSREGISADAACKQTIVTTLGKE